MDPLTQAFVDSPRDLATDAFFLPDRSGTRVTRMVGLQELATRTLSSVSVAGFTSRHVVSTLDELNPLPHRRMTGGPNSVLDTSLAGWTHTRTYRHFASASAASLAGDVRLRVTLLFGTGSEAHRHGVVATIAGAAQPTLLIIVPGIEPGYTITFTDPSSQATPRTLQANNRWGVGITTAIIEKIITARYGRVVPYDIVIAAAYSTGYLGLGGSITNRLFPLDKLQRIVIYDCLYGELRQPLTFIKGLRGKDLEIVAYIVTGAGNSFTSKDPSFGTLELGGNPTWNYINLFFNPTYHAVASARVVDEGRTAGNPIITSLPGAYETALDAVVSKLPARTTVVSDWNVYRHVKGTPPSGAVPLVSVGTGRQAALGAFFQQVGVTRQCIGRGQLLGWAPKPGEEWHDLLLVEFGWEYLT